MATDVITINPEVFGAAKININTQFIFNTDMDMESILLEKVLPKIDKENKSILENIIKTYRNLYLTYPCFTTQQTHAPLRNAPVYNPRRQRRGLRAPGTSGFRSGCDHKNNMKNNYRKFNSNNCILGYLNIINQSNYDRIWMKIYRSIDETYAEKITSEILQQCTKQIAYKDIFLRLLQDIYNKTDNEKIRKIISSTVDDFLESYLQSKDFVIKLERETNYDHFCNQQKHKVIVLSKNSINLRLIEISMVSTTMDDYTRVFQDHLNDMLCDDDIDYYLDIMIDILGDILRSSLSGSRQLICVNSEKLIQRTESNQKLKFMVEDLMIQLYH